MICADREVLNSGVSFAANTRPRTSYTVDGGEHCRHSQSKVSKRKPTRARERTETSSWRKGEQGQGSKISYHWTERGGRRGLGRREGTREHGGEENQEEKRGRHHRAAIGPA
eukprot:1082251-Rhodomonas_salina.1